MPAKSTSVQLPPALRPYHFHGIQFDLRGENSDPYVTCPFCDREKKFNIRADNGLFRCVVCDQSGNLYNFLRALHERSMRQTSDTDYLQLSSERRLLSIGALKDWGVCRSSLSGDWLVPAYNDNKEVSQLYRYAGVFSREKGMSYHLMPTPSGSTELLEQSILGLQNFDQEKPDVWLCEGVWDAIALFEILKRSKWGMDTEGGMKLVPTASIQTSVMADINVLAVPGALQFKDSWALRFKGKNVVLAYDSDYPRMVDNVDQGRAGWRGIKKVAGVLLGHGNQAASVKYVKWGEQGFDPSKPSGYDLRDAIAPTVATSIRERATLLDSVMSKLTDAPDSWRGQMVQRTRGVFGVESNYCSDYKVLTEAWKRYLRWRPDLDDGLSVLLAVCASTDQPGQQLFLQLISNPGSAKTTLCEGLLASDWCRPLEKTTGFFSGTVGKNGEDYSLVNHINHKTVICSEANTLLTGPYAPIILAEMRRIFDGNAVSRYKSSGEDRVYTNLRTPFILAGTPAMLNNSDASLGDRFLRLWLDEPDENEQYEITMRAIRNAALDTTLVSNGDARSAASNPHNNAKELTGGYVDYLRANVNTLIRAIPMDENVNRKCRSYAVFVAQMRARPDRSPTAETDTIEEPNRLGMQLIRLARNLAVVLGEQAVTPEVMRRVRRVALSTARGPIYTVVDHLWNSGPGGLDKKMVCNYLGRSTKQCDEILGFMKRKPAEMVTYNYGRYYLTDKMKGIWRRVVKTEEPV